MHALAGHRHESLAVEAAEVLAEFDRPEAERARTSQDGQLQRLQRVFRTQRHGIRRVVGRGHVGFPNHLEHRRLGIDVPVGRSDTGPTVAVEVLTGFAESSQRCKVGPPGIRKSDDRGEALGVPTRVIRTGSVLRMGSGKGVPRDVVE